MFSIDYVPTRLEQITNGESMSKRNEIQMIKPKLPSIGFILNEFRSEKSRAFDHWTEISWNKDTLSSNSFYCAPCALSYLNPTDKLIFKKLSLSTRSLIFALSCHRSTKWWIVVVAVRRTKRKWFVCHAGQFLISSLSFSFRIQNIIAQLKISYFSDLKECQQQQQHQRQWRNVSDNNEILISIFHSLN